LVAALPRLLRVTLPAVGVAGATPFLLDSSSYARALTAAGGAVQVPSGKYGSALDNRTIGASGVSTPDASELYFGTLAVPFCIEAWVKFNAVGTGVFVSQWATSNMAWWMGYSASNTVAFVYSANGSTQGGIVAQPWTPTVGVWYHVCANRTAGNVCNVYVDGVRLATTPTGFQFFNSTAALMIGNAVSGLSAFNGYIDEVRVSKVDRYGAVASFTPPSAAFVSDADTLLLAHF
jgi:hypothetical protein